MKLALVSLLTLLCSAIAIPALEAQTHIPGELGIYNASLYNYRRSNIPFSEPTHRTFLPMVAYLDGNGIPLEYMMDAFVLYDPQLANHGIGMAYDKDVLRGFLDDTFIRAQAPFTTSDAAYGPSPNGRSAILHTAGEFSLGQVNQGAIPMQGPVTCTLAAYFRSDAGTDRIRLGFMLFDAAGQRLTPASVCQPLNPAFSWREDPGYWFLESEVASAWERVHATIGLPSCVASVSVHIARANVRDDCGSRAYMDYAQLVAGSSAALLTDGQLRASGFTTLLADGGFEGPVTSTPWRRAGYPDRSFALFADRLCAMDGLKQAVDVARGSIGEPPLIRVVLMLPAPCDLSDANKSQRLSDIRRYLQESEAAFVDWRTRRSDAAFSLAGWYYEAESIVQDDDDDGLWDGFIDSLHTIVQQQGGRLHAAARYRFTSAPPPASGGECAYEPYVQSSFDCIWAMPNCFEVATAGSSTGDVASVDLDAIEFVARDAIANGFGINVERKFTSADAESQELAWGYGRVVDYFLAGYKHGFVNFTHCYFDAGGVWWYSAYSQDPRERQQYAMLNQFVRDTRRGAVPNAGFEHADVSGVLESWTGQYSLVRRTSEFHSLGQYYVSCLPGMDIRPAHRISIDPTANYRVGGMVRELGSDDQSNSALIALEFFDKDGQELRIGAAGLTWSTILDAWFQYLDPGVAWDEHSIGFDPPPSAVSARLILRNWSGESRIEWDNIYVEWNGQRTGVFTDWSAVGPITLKALDDPVYQLEEFPLPSGGSFTVRVAGKETKEDGDKTSALCRVDYFDTSGALLGEEDVDPEGLNWSSQGGFWYAYVDVESDVPASASWLESRWRPWTRRFEAPTTARMARVSFYRWTNDVNNFVVFENPQVTNVGVVDVPKPIAGISPRIRVIQNPARGTVRLGYDLARNSDGDLEILDVRGRIVARIELGNSGQAPSGTIDWNGRLRSGMKAVSGVYWVRLRGGKGAPLAEAKFVLLSD